MTVEWRVRNAPGWRKHAASGQAWEMFVNGRFAGSCVRWLDGTVTSSRPSEFTALTPDGQFQTGCTFEGHPACSLRDAASALLKALKAEGFL